MKWRIFASLLACLCAGCNSFSTTAISRFDDDSFSGQSNGTLKHHQQARPFKGFPITLKVPTHLDVFIDETYFVGLGKTQAGLKELLAGQGQLLSVRTEPIKTDKVFFVDFKRPASGTLDLKMTFDEEEQYFKSIVSKLEDTTIVDTANLIATATKSIAGLSASDVRVNPDVVTKLKDSGVEVDRRTVAFRRFDINSATFEDDLECFVNQHLQQGCVITSAH